eukprot:GFUD01134661.1.p1 GENE.GFUD01134661.1~~GFUD01134661.1.p1  ORF type:complete len:225 (+),score=33.59 GFUD01134661.1:42-716(+)
MSYITTDSGAGKWEDILLWYPNAKYATELSVRFEESQENKFFDFCTNVSQVNLEEQMIKSLVFYKTPLNDGASLLESIDKVLNYLWFTPSVVTLAYKLCHVYIVAETETKIETETEITTTTRFFGFSKGCSAIEVYQSKDPEGIKAHQQFNRSSTIKKTSAVTASVADIMHWIFKSGQITRGYDTGAANCKDFAMALWNEFTPEHEHVSPSFLPSSMCDTGTSF